MNVFSVASLAVIRSNESSIGRFTLALREHFIYCEIFFSLDCKVRLEQMYGNLNTYTYIRSKLLHTCPSAIIMIMGNARSERS